MNKQRKYYICYEYLFSSVETLQPRKFGTEKLVCSAKRREREWRLVELKVSMVLSLLAKCLGWKHFQSTQHSTNWVYAFYWLNTSWHWNVPENYRQSWASLTQSIYATSCREVWFLLTTKPRWTKLFTQKFSSAES